MALMATATPKKKTALASVAIEELSTAFVAVTTAAKRLIRTRPEDITIRMSASGENEVASIPIPHGDEDGETEIILSGIFGSKPKEVRMGFFRGTSTPKGYEQHDLFMLAFFSQWEDDGLYELIHGQSSGYETILVRFDPSTDTASFPKGVGPKRQHRALAILKLMEERLLGYERGE